VEPPQHIEWSMGSYIKNGWKIPEKIIFLNVQPLMKLFFPENENNLKFLGIPQSQYKNDQERIRGKKTKSKSTKPKEKKRKYKNIWSGSKVSLLKL